MEIDTLSDDYESVATAPHDLLKIIILERRKFFIDALEYYNKNRFENRGVTLARVRAELISLFYELQAAILRDSKKWNGDHMSYDELKGKVFSNEVTDLQEAFCFINEWLDRKGIIRVDTRVKYDYTKVEHENKIKQL